MAGASPPAAKALGAMGRLGRDFRRRKLEALLGQADDEKLVRLVALVTAALKGEAGAARAVVDLPEDAVGTEIGSPGYIPPWILETLVNELLAAPKQAVPGRGRYRILRTDSYAVLRRLTNLIISLENAEDGIFLAAHDVFTEMHRLAQRQFPWQRGVFNAPAFYRSLRLYGSGKAAEHFEREAGVSSSDFVKIGVWLAGVLGGREAVRRDTDLSELGIMPDVKERALARIAISHAEARQRTRRIRGGKLHTAYRPSLLRDYPIIAFGAAGERLRAPLPELITQRFTAGRYLDVVGGGAAVWTEIGERFEAYCVDYLKAMLAPLTVVGEQEYGPKKARRRTPDILVSDREALVLVAECKAKRMTFEARFSEDPIADAAAGYAEIARGMFQIWRFRADARRRMVVNLPPMRDDCLAILLTVDPWLTMARNQEKDVLAAAHKLADAEGGIAPQDRCPVPVCLIDDVEHVLQQGTAQTFLAACREIAYGEKAGWILSIAHAAELQETRPYPFTGAIADHLPWWSDHTMDLGRKGGTANRRGQAAGGDEMV